MDMLAQQRQSITEAIGAQEAESAKTKEEKQLLLLQKSAKQQQWQQQHLLISDTQKRINQEIAQLQTAQSRLNMLKEMKKDYEGFSYSVKQILSRCDKDPQMQQLVCGGCGAIGICAPKIRAGH